ncbi:opioid growth factor receptor [Gloeophyllum trabeum ATCC 11539]|uniref:Opioid growth factor receptor n=1 Tax=Gloeophyllum trabeum (strain ATCC 11539 / FP-39264 / Madison 617) TaxID=670483 RepID=S7RP60_GLOTA|nr:opioid growth factor receptor [Gloeophyllum trabeum ATCC 11539]EPQ54589.1 opioid growth factor receptor [Gloeophyllum trabeum ATCC 11539]
MSTRRVALPRDIVEFLDSYPGEEDDISLNANLEFYSNRLRCRPDNLLIDELHERWLGDYQKLEYKHGYIQWLFPIREHGMNYESQPLQTHEIEFMRNDEQIMGRLLLSYRLMLDFYGMRLESQETGLLNRSPSSHFGARYQNLVRSSHNNLRISRILKCLSEFGLERLNAGFLLHVLNEQSEHGHLNSPMLLSSMDRWWTNCLRNEEERLYIASLIQKARGDPDFVFSRGMYEEALERRRSAGRLGP